MARRIRIFGEWASGAFLLPGTLTILMVARFTEMDFNPLAVLVWAVLISICFWALIGTAVYYGFR